MDGNVAIIAILFYNRLNIILHILPNPHQHGPGSGLGSKLTPGTLLRDYFKEPLVHVVRLKYFYQLCLFFKANGGNPI